MTPRVVKAKCKTILGGGVLPVAGDVGILLGIAGSGTTYCAQFRGTESRNDERAVVRKNAPAPAACPPSSPSAAFLDAGAAP